MRLLLLLLLLSVDCCRLWYVLYRDLCVRMCSMYIFDARRTAIHQFAWTVRVSYLYVGINLCINKEVFTHFGCVLAFFVTLDVVAAAFLCHSIAVHWYSATVIRADFAVVYELFFSPSTKESK